MESTDTSAMEEQDHELKTGNHHTGSQQVNQMRQLDKQMSFSPIGGIGVTSLNSITQPCAFLLKHIYFHCATNRLNSLHGYSDLYFFCLEDKVSNFEVNSKNQLQASAAADIT